MIDVTVKLKSKTWTTDSIGNQVEQETLIEVPIKEIDKVYASEFYKGAQAGYKPAMRIIISELNYAGENELNYKGTDYSIIRTENVNLDEIALICQVKINEN